MALKRPRRRSYVNEPDFLIACLRYLDARHPGREGQRKRVAAWRRWEQEYEPDALVARIGELVSLILAGDMTPEEDDELDRLVAIWHEQRRNARQHTDTTERNRS